jgi:PIN domain nuclease of toxin-antitoxin system
VNEVVLDASALLAVLRAAPGADRVESRLEGAGIGAVNLFEVVAKLDEDGVREVEIRRAIGRLDLDIHAFDAAKAYTAGALRRTTRRLASRSVIGPALLWHNGWARSRSRRIVPGRGSRSEWRSR